MTNTHFMSILESYIYLSDELCMYLSWTKLRNIFLGGSTMLLFFLAFLFSDQVMIGFSEFAFLSGTEQTSTVSFEITWGFTTGFTIAIYNKELTDITYKLGFVDGFITTDGFNHTGCLSPHEQQEFWQYITWDTTPFTLAAETSGTQNISITFPNTHSGIYRGCITLNGIPTNGNSDVNTLPVRGIFLDARVHSNAFTVNVKAFPSNRVYQSTNNANTGILKLYDNNKILISTSLPFTLNSVWTGEAFISAPAGVYYVIFRGQSHLASYLSWVIIWWTGSDYFDFTTGSNLYNAQQLDDATDDGKRYQTAGDLINSLWIFDHLINGNDLTVVLWSPGHFPEVADVWNPRNLNGDNEINTSDIGIIGTNFLKQDPFYNDPYNPGWILFIW